MVFPEKQSQPSGCRFSALPRASKKLRFQQRNSRFPVTEFTIQRHLHERPQRIPLQIQEFSGVKVRRAVVQIARKVNVQHLLRVAGRGEVRAQILQPSRAESRLLRELARRRPLRCFPGSSLPAGSSSSVREKRIAVLPHAPDRAVGLQRQHRHAARMLHDLALGRAAVGGGAPRRAGR